MVPKDGDRSILHIWRIPLQVRADRIENLGKVLSQEERERASRFVTQRLSTRFSVCRAAVRVVLADYMSVIPRKVQFFHTDKGKPYVKGTGTGRELRFNVSHSEDVAVLGITWQREIGIDVEAKREIGHVEQLVDRCLGPLEKKAFRRRERASTSDLFLRYWTHKEAYLKAIGEGLQIPMSSVEFDLEAEGSGRLLSCPATNPRSRQMVVADFNPGDGYYGAFAVEGQEPITVRLFDWSEQIDSLAGEGTETN